MSTQEEKQREKKADTAVIPHLERHSQYSTLTFTTKTSPKSRWLSNDDLPNDSAKQMKLASSFIKDLPQLVLFMCQKPTSALISMSPSC